MALTCSCDNSVASYASERLDKIHVTIAASLDFAKVFDKAWLD